MTAIEDAGTFVACGVNRWWFVVPIPSQPTIVARLMDGWMLCAAEAPSIEPVEALIHNAGFPPQVKLVHPHQGRMQLRAELPLEGENDAEASLPELARSFAGAFTSLGEAKPTEAPAIVEWNAMPAEAVLALCKTIGWEAATERDRVRVRLAVDDGRRAMLSPVGEGLRASVRIGSLADVPADCAAAVAHLLAAVGANVRFVRPVLREASAELEIFFPKPPTPGLLEAALAALSVALDLCGREAAVLLGNESLARTYLARCARHTARAEVQTRTGEHT